MNRRYLLTLIWVVILWVYIGAFSVIAENASNTTKNITTQSKTNILVTDDQIKWPQTIATGLIAAIGIFIANLILDRVRDWYYKPDLHMDENPYPVSEPINLEIFNVREPNLKPEFWHDRKFVLKYRVYGMKVHNHGRRAAEDCKGVLNDGEDKKISWNVPSERHKMTINAKSFEFLDVYAVLESNEANEDLQKGLKERVERLGYELPCIDGITRPNEHREVVEELLKEHKDNPGYLIPLIIAPTENGFQQPPHLNWHVEPGNWKVTVSSKNAEPIIIDLKIGSANSL